jgi:uncharacterized protein (TIGR01777 family)
MKVVIGGGSGLVGSALAASLAADGNEVAIVSRHPAAAEPPMRSIGWDDVGAEIDGADAVVNLAGVSLGGPRWTTRRKEAIRSSRVQTTASLARAIAAAATPPRVFVTASGIDYAGNRGDEIVDETGPPGASFLGTICAQWEAASAGAPIRRVAVRTAFVIDRRAPALRLLVLPSRLFVGGRLGSGKQWFPWIHLDDLVRIYRRAIDDPSLEGAVNAAAPQQLRQRDAAKDIGAVLHRPAAIPTPAFLLRAALGEQADLLLHGQRVVSPKLGDFEFRYRALRAALEDALG